MFIYSNVNLNDSPIQPVHIKYFRILIFHPTLDKIIWLGYEFLSTENIQDFLSGAINVGPNQADP